MEHGLEAASPALAAALGRRDAPAAAALYAEDGTLLASTSELIRGRSQIEAYWRAGIGVGVSRVELSATELRIERDVAIEVGRYALDVRGAGGAERGSYFVLHRRQGDGSWLRAAEVFNPDVPQGSRPHDKEEQ